MKLTQDQITELKKELVDDGVPVRFLLDGCALDITSGIKSTKRSNVMYHPTYWYFTKETAKKIADWLGAKPVWDK